MESLSNFVKKLRVNTGLAAERSRKIFKPIADPINRFLSRQVKATPVVQSLSGFERGLREGGAGFTGAEKYLPKQIQPRLPEYNTPASKVGRFAGGVVGFAAGPGKLTAPLEAATALKFGKFLPQTTGIVAKGIRKLAPAVAAETATSIPLGIAEGTIKGKPIPQTIAEQAAYGVLGRGIFGTAGKALGVGNVDAKSKFTLDTKTFDDLVDAGDMMKNPQAYLRTIDTSKFRTKKEALKYIQSQGVEMVERVSAKYLPNKELTTLKSPEAKLKALVDLSDKNKLTNIPNMGFVNESELKVKPPGKERGFIKTVREAETTAKPVAEQVKGFYSPKSNAESVQRAQLRIDTEGWDAAKKLAVEGPQTAENTTIGMELMRRAQDNKQFDEAIDIAQKMAAKGTEAGQAIQAFSIWGRMTPEGMLKYAAKLVNKSDQEVGLATKFARKVFGTQTPKLTSKDAESITNFMKKANSATGEGDKAKYVKAALEVINDKIPYGASELIDTYRYNNLLSNPLTHLRNFTSNALQTFFTRPLTKAVSGDIKGAYKYYGGLYRGFGDAVNEMNKSLKGETKLENLDIRELRIDKAPGFLTIPTKAMDASDKFFQTLIKSGEIAGGKSEAEAIKTAKYSLFRGELDSSNKSGQGNLLSAIDRATEGVGQLGKKFPAVRWFVPFIQTPMNISKQWIEYSPAGLLTAVGNSNKKEQFAKAMIGSTVTALAGKLAFDGRTTWEPPTDPEEKELYYASGKKPFSVKVGDNWVPLQTFGIFAFPIALAASVKHMQEDSKTALTDNQVEKLARSLLGQAKFFANSTYMNGLGNMVSLVSGDQDYSLASNLGFTATQAIPFSGLASYIARVIDPVFRKPEGEGPIAQAISSVKRGIPFASKSLPAYTTPEGEESKRNLSDYIAPYGQGKENPKYVLPLVSRTKRLQENQVLSKELKEFKRLDSQVDNMIESGNVEGAREVIRNNKDIFKKGNQLKELKSDIKEWQDARKDIASDVEIDEIKKKRLLARIDTEVEKRLNLINRL